ncbi:MAG: alanine--tRNA ligase [Clostridia bacterium]|nr:alanine--tRNA ligase [Clostridia bacterium]
MEWMSLNTLREKYLSFFESKGHLRLGSFPLVPKNDNSLLLINSGMAPMKKYFTGEVTPPRSRVTTCQKCIRTPDLERVGKTARHGTYFEMLGNFSFGDYFKNEAIPWAWEFLTVTVGIPENLLWPSIYENDEEAFNIWKNVIGVPEERIVRLGKADNFWEHGTGPCGPCSEIYFDRGEKYGCGSPDCKPGCDCDRYMEIWNNVFTQFNNMGDGTYTELAQKNIDTGMGLERLACVIQGVDNMFEVDTIKNIIEKVCAIAGKKYSDNKDDDVSIRVITDHVRGSTFMICDGVIPSNEGRGYVLRRLLRRAARHGKLLGINDMFLNTVCDAVIAENKDAYPELIEKKDLIKKIIGIEEENFGKTIDKGLKMLDEIIASGVKTVSGEDAFRLYDTYGFPLDLTKDILEEKGIAVDEDRFAELMKEQKELARSSRKAADAESWKSEGNIFSDAPATEFLGYTADSCETSILALAVAGERAASASLGDKVAVVLDATVFYGESGGQVGDTGVIKGDGFAITISDTSKDTVGVFTHVGTVTEGEVKVGDSAVAEIDVTRRNAIRRNHTAAHLLQAALREVLGTHVEQAGQLVNEKAVRFDFTHFSALTSEELAKVEALVNDAVLSAIEVQNDEMPIDEARKLGAMALFGEKYGDVVRVVNVKDRSIELCGGTHVKNTSAIGLFKIMSEASVASGVRRIEAVTGSGVLEYIEKLNSQVLSAAAVFKLNNPAELTKKCESVVAELKEKDKVIESFNAKLANSGVAEMLGSAKDIGGVKLATATFTGLSSDAIREMCDKIRDAEPTCVAVLVNTKEDGANIAVTVGKDAAAKGIMAGKAVGAIAAVAGGKGGGRPDFAMAGTKDTSKLSEALAAAEGIITSMMN